MKDYLENILHMKIKTDDSESLYDHLPLLYKGTYNIFKVDSGGVEWIAMQPKTNVRLNQLRKNRAFLENKTQLNAALILERTSFYSKDKMIEEGIPFIICNDTVYLPFLGILLGKKQRELKPVNQISFLTQRVLLIGLYEGYNKATVTYLSKQLKVSKMAVSKSFDEIEYLDIGVMDHDGRRRSITMGNDKKSVWEKIHPYMRNPVIRAFDLKEDVHLLKKAGITALSEYSMLEDNSYPTYAVEKSEIGTLGIREQKQVARGDDIGCRVFEVGYFIDCVKENVQDPLSVVLSIEDELDDERVEISVEEMMKDYVW